MSRAKHRQLLEACLALAHTWGMLLELYGWPGLLFPKKTPPCWYRDFHYKLKWSSDRLKFIMGIHIRVRHRLISEWPMMLDIPPLFASRHTVHIIREGTASSLLTLRSCFPGHLHSTFIYLEDTAYIYIYIYICLTILLRMLRASFRFQNPNNPGGTTAKWSFRR